MSALVLLHGFGSSFDHNWQQTGWVDILADFGVTVPPIDLPGHGSSPPLTDPAEYDHADEDVRDALPADGPSRASDFLPGQSYCYVSLSPSRSVSIGLSSSGWQIMRSSRVTQLHL